VKRAADWGRGYAPGSVGPCGLSLPPPVPSGRTGGHGREQLTESHSAVDGLLRASAGTASAMLMLATFVSATTPLLRLGLLPALSEIGRPPCSAALRPHSSGHAQVRPRYMYRSHVLRPHSSGHAQVRSCSSRAGHLTVLVRNLLV
jgi:hypothetical protein